MWKQKPSGYWDIKQNCIDEAKNYTRRSEFKKSNNTVYKKLTERGWLQEACLHMELMIKPVGYWNKIRCSVEAIKYTTKGDFERGCKSAYAASVKGKWLNDICEHMTMKCGNRFLRLIYVYEFEDKSAYIGLTYNIDKRQKQRDKSEKDQVTKYIKKKPD